MNSMKIEYDPDKNNRNIKERNLSFEQATELDWETAQIVEDIRQDYPEQRFVAIWPLAGEAACHLFHTDNRWNQSN